MSNDTQTQRTPSLQTPTASQPAATMADMTGSRAGMVVDDLVVHTCSEVDSWMQATKAATGLARPDHREVLASLARSREHTIRQRLSRLPRLTRTLSSLESQRSVIRQHRRQLIGKRDQSKTWSRQYSEAVHELDRITDQLLEVERCRAETIADASRTALASISEAKALYAQVGALSGMGRMEVLPGMSLGDHTEAPPAANREPTREYQHG